MRHARSTRGPAPRPAASAAERGSAYLFALLVLLVLTVVGLSLALVTQSEVQIGAAEKTTMRALYSSDAAMRVQLASLFFGDPQERTMRFTDPFTVADATIRDEVRASAFYPIYSGPCNLCGVNQGNDRYWTINHVVSAETRRLAVDALGGETTYADKVLTQMFLVQPIKREQGIDALRTVTNINSIKY